MPMLKRCSCFHWFHMVSSLHLLTFLRLVFEFSQHGLSRLGEALFLYIIRECSTSYKSLTSCIKMKLNMLNMLNISHCITALSVGQTSPVSVISIRLLRLSEVRSKPWRSFGWIEASMWHVLDIIGWLCERQNVGKQEISDASYSTFCGSETPIWPI